jgi:GNAT superfamily N-acetyltransferase
MTSPASQPGITIEELRPDDAHEVADFYQRILAPHFRADELEVSGTFATRLKSGDARALVARTALGQIVGGAVGDVFPETRVLLLSYIAVPAEGRGTGTGALLMKAVTEVWSRRFNPSLFVMEVEDPRHFQNEAAFGDPEARVRFHERHGARALPIPFFQPALGPDGNRIRNLMLMVFGGTEAPQGAERVDGRIVEAFLTEYLEGCEGPISPDDAEAQSLLAACRRPGGLPLLKASELAAWIPE